MKIRLIVSLAVLLIGGAIAVDQVSPANPIRRATVTFAPDAGVLTCPYLTEPNATASLQLANVGARASAVRVNMGAAKGAPIVVPVTVPAGATVSVPVPPTAASRAGAVVEYSGGTLVATHVLSLGKGLGPVVRAPGTAAAPCARAAAGDIVISGASTSGADTQLALFNPGAADADVSVSLIADGRVFQPQRLTRRVIASRTRQDFRLGDYAFNAHTLTAIIHANAGRVIAEALVRSTVGAELLPGQVPANEVVAIAGQTGAGSMVGVTVVGDDNAGIAPSVINASTQASVGGFPSSLPPDAGRSFAVPDQGNGAPAAYDFRVDVGSPIVAGTTWTVTSGGEQEIASLPGIAPAVRWVGVLGAVQPGVPVRAIVVNPQGSATTAHITTIGTGGTNTQTITVPGGRLADLTVGRGPGIFAVVIDSDRPVVLALRSTAFARNGVAASVAVTGESFDAPQPVGVGIEPRAGIPAVVPS